MACTGGAASVRQNSAKRDFADFVTDFVGKSACTWGLPQPIQRCSHLFHDHGQVNKHWEHSHRPFPSRKPSFHSISVMCRFWICLFDTRSGHQNAKWSKCPTPRGAHLTHWPACTCQNHGWGFLPCRPCGVSKIAKIFSDAKKTPDLTVATRLRSTIHQF